MSYFSINFKWCCLPPPQPHCKPIFPLIVHDCKTLVVDDISPCLYISIVLTIKPFRKIQVALKPFYLRNLLKYNNWHTIMCSCFYQRSTAFPPLCACMLFCWFNFQHSFLTMKAFQNGLHVALKPFHIWELLKYMRQYMLLSQINMLSFHCAYMLFC